ncbi:MAG: plasmid mobilization relaxosome protein MobC [Cyclobacteriaceae bacterium]|nr:plasmid mobilization relaxosome protein MobC [Cyclobacteriaceae bacterium]
MARRKSPYPEQLLTRHIQTKVTEEVYQRLDELRGKSDCQTIGELARRILSKDKITLFHKDASLDGPMEELTSIRKELKAIGTNINQITHSFHLATTDTKKNFQALRIVEEYKKVGLRVDKLFELITQLSRKWLQK